MSTFPKFTKSFDDFFSKKKFDVSKNVKMNTISADGTKLESTLFWNDDGSFTSKLKVTKSHPLAKLEAEFATDGNAKVKVESEAVAKGLKLTVSDSHCVDTGAEQSLEAEYQLDAIRAGAGLTIGSKTIVNAHAAVGVPVQGLSVGGQVDYDVNKQELSDYAAGLEYKAKDLSAVVRTKKRAELLRGAFLHSVNSSVDAGADVEYNVTNGDSKVTFGSFWRLDGNTQLKGKVDNKGVFQSVYEQRLSGIYYAFNGKFDLNAKSAVPKEYGFSLVFGNNDF